MRCDTCGGRIAIVDTTSKAQRFCSPVCRRRRHNATAHIPAHVVRAMATRDRLIFTSTDYISVTR